MRHFIWVITVCQSAYLYNEASGKCMSVNKIYITHFRKNENIELNFGDKVELGSVPKLYLHVQM